MCAIMGSISKPFFYAGATVVFILAVPVAVVAFLYKSFVCWVCSTFCHDLDEPLDSIGMLLGDDIFSRKNTSPSVVSVLEVEGMLTLSEVVNQVEDLLQLPSSKNEAMTRYPQLRQYPTCFLGYLFWTREPHFKILDHVSEKVEDFEGLGTIHEKMHNMPIVPRRSPWDVVIFRERNSGRTHLAFKVHHCMADGRSVVKLLIEGLGKKSLQTKEPMFQHPIHLHWTSVLSGILNVVSDLIEMQFQYFIESQLRQGEYEVDTQQLVQFGKSLSLKRLKKLSKAMGVSVSSLILCTVSTSLNKFLGNITSEAVYLTLPKQLHPDSMANHLYISFPRIPARQDKVKGLQNCDEIYKNLRFSDNPRYLEMATELVAMLPRPLRAKIYKTIGVRSGLSNIAGDEQGFSVNGKACTGFSMSAGLPANEISISVVTLSYKDTIQVGVVAQASKFSPADIQHLAKLMDSEFDSWNDLQQ